MKTNVSEKENIFQALYIVAIVLLKRRYGMFLNDYENIIFVFLAALGLYLIHWLLTKLYKGENQPDDWEEKLDIMTIVVYGFGLLLLKWLQVTNVWVMLLVGGLLVAINVIIKYKRRSIKKKMDAQ